MLNWSNLKNVALAATVLSSALSVIAGRSAYAENGFKFPVLLCRFKQAELKNSGGTLKVVTDREWGPEYAFPVDHARASGGDFSGVYEISGSSYRLRLEGSIEQGFDVAGNHQLRLRTVLEKKLDKVDATGKLWQEVGQSSHTVVAKNQADGSVWENVYPYTFNAVEMQRYLVNGKLKQDLVIAGIRDGLLDQGSVFKVGPACGFLDARTAKSVASAENRQKYRSIFDRIPDRAQDGQDSSLVASRSEPKKRLELKLPAPEAQVAKTDANSAGNPADPRDERDEREKREQQQQQELLAQNGGAPAQQEMSPELQNQLAQQNQLADQAAAAYNFQQHQAQNGQAGAVEGRDLASAQASQTMQVGQVAQNLQALQSPEQVQQHLNQLEQQKAALVQQQILIDQQQQFLAQKQQDLSAQTSQTGDASQGQQIQSSQAAPVGQGF